MLFRHIEVIEIDRAMLDLRIACIAAGGDEAGAKEFQANHSSLMRKVIETREHFNPAGVEALKRMFGGG